MTRTIRRPEFEVIHVASGVVAISGISKTEATKMAREMSANRPGSVVARRIKSKR